MFFQHGGPGSTLGFQIDLSSLQGANTVFISIHFFGPTVVLLHVITISPEEGSGEEAHLKKAEGGEKPQTGGSKGSQYLSKDYKKIHVFFFRTQTIEFETDLRPH